MNTVFKFPKACKVDLSVSKNAGRYPLENPYCDGDRIAATNGWTLVVVPVKLEEKFTGPIPCELFRRGRKRMAGNTDMSIVVTDSSLKIETEQVLFERDKSSGFKFPDIDKVVEPAKNAEPAITFDINPKLLMDLASALVSPKSIRITVPKVSSKSGNVEGALIVKPVYSNSPEGTFGLIMPMRNP